MPIHHIIPKHEWRKRFRDLKGFNDPDNKVSLTTEQHSQVHLHYFNEITHIIYDRIASHAISGQIGKEEAYIQAVKLANTGKKHSVKFCADRKKRMRGVRLTETWKKNISKGQLGNKRGPHKPEHTRKQSEAQLGDPRGPYQKSICPHCKKSGGCNAMTRWHFNNCKLRVGELC